MESEKNLQNKLYIKFEVFLGEHNAENPTSKGSIIILKRVSDYRYYFGSLENYSVFNIYV